MRRSPPEAGCLALGPGGQAPDDLRSSGRLSARPALLAAVLAVAAAFSAPQAAAQSGAAQRSWAVSPTAGLSQTVTNNYLLSDADPSFDAITRATAGLAVTANTGSVKGFLDYSLSGVGYLRHSDRNSIQNSLSSRLTAEIDPGRAGLDVAANISRSAISAFGAQPNAGLGVQDNVTEIRTLRVAPRLLGPLGPNLRYNANLALSATDAKDTSAGDVTAATLGVHLEPVARGRLSWVADATAQRTDYKAGNSSSNERLTIGSHLTLDDIDTEVTGSAGVEYATILTGARQRYSNWGVGLAWAPNNRTRVSAKYDDRFFGPSRNLAVDHRTALTSWHFSKSRSLTAPGAQAETSGRGTAFDLLFTQFASALPDPTQRTEFVNAYLQSRGINPVASPDFLRSSITIDEVDELAVAYRAVRSVAVLTLMNSKSTRLGVQPGIADDLSSSAAVYLKSIGLDLTHQLTPDSSVGLQLNRVRGSGTNLAQNTLQRRLGGRYSLRAYRTVDLAVGLSRTLYDKFQSSYGESAIVVTLGYRF